MIIFPRRRILFEDHRLDPHTSFAFKEFRVSHFPFNWHYHPEVELTLIVKGHGLRFVGDSIQDYGDGDLCLLGSNTPHTWQSTPVKRQSVRSLVILFRKEFLGEQLLKIPEARKIKNLLDRSRRGLRITGKTRDAIAQQMHRMLDQPRGSFQHVLGLLSMLSTIADSRDCVALGTCEIDPVTNKDAHSRLSSVLRSVNDDTQEFPSQQVAARLARLSPPAFSRFFKRSVGKTYVGYLNELRINRACRALIETDLNITQIAYDAGFNNLSNFNRRFLSLKRMTPRAYRTLAQTSSAAARKALRNAEWNKVQTKIPWQE